MSRLEKIFIEISLRPLSQLLNAPFIYHSREIMLPIQQKSCLFVQKIVFFRIHIKNCIFWSFSVCQQQKLFKFFACYSRASFILYLCLKMILSLLCGWEHIYCPVMVKEGFIGWLATFKVCGDSDEVILLIGMRWKFIDVIWGCVWIADLLWRD